MKKFSLVLACLAFTAYLNAQTKPSSVQGIARDFSSVPSSVKKTASTYTAVNLDSIKYWVGNDTCSNKAALVIKFNDGKGVNALVWGYRWAAGTVASGEQMFRAIASADPRLYLFTQNTNYGATVCGIGLNRDSEDVISGNLIFDLDGAMEDTEHINFRYFSSQPAPALSLGQTSYPENLSYTAPAAAIDNALATGILQHPFDTPTYGYAAYDYDYWLLKDTDVSGSWRSGWYDGYWSYWCGTANSTDYIYSGLGMTSRMLSNGDVDGWSYVTDMTVWYSADMSGAITYIEAPSTVMNIARTDDTMEENIIYVTNTETSGEGSIGDVSSSIDKTKKNIIIFDESLAGKTISLEKKFYLGKNKADITINGNGVILECQSGYFYIGGSPKTINDLNIKGWVNTAGDNEKFVNCTFTGIDYETKTKAILLESDAKDGEYIGCRFSGLRSYSSTTTSAAAFYGSYSGVYKFVSCTFKDNISVHTNEGMVTSNPNGAHVTLDVNNNQNSFYNCVFDDANKGDLTGYYQSGYSIITGAECIFENNVVEGTVYNKTAGAAYEFSSTNVNDSDLGDIVTWSEDLNEYAVAEGSKAIGNLPANTAIEGVTFPEKDILGNTIDYTNDTQSGACQTILSSQEEEELYVNGTFIVNEDWYGHQNSTVNWISDDGEWTYRVFQKANPGHELGCTTQYGTIYGDKFYLVSKQQMDPGASITGSRFAVCNAKTMKLIKEFEYIATNSDGTSIADGRSFLPVNEHKGYIGTSNGMWIYDMDNMEIGGQIEGSGNPNSSGYGQLYYAQVGTMLRKDEYVYAVHQQNGLMIIDPETDEIVRTIQAPNEDGTQRGFGSIVLSKDGNLWLSVAANQSGSGATVSYILKYDPVTQDTVRINVPEGYYSPANSWYAWTPDGFCASTQKNVLYWNGGNNSWFSNKYIFKYDIDTDTFSKYIDLDSEDWKIYGCSFRVDPVTDEAYVSLYKEFGDPTYVLRKYDSEGNVLAEYSMITNYWFPSLPVFPDNADPVVNGVGAVDVTSSDSKTVSLDGIASDEDNMTAAMVKTIKSISNESVLSAEMLNGDLVITPLADGTADITIQINSNGKLAECVVSVTVTGASAIDNVDAESGATVVSRYTLDGKLLNAPQRGINIIRMSDGTIKKVIVK